MFGNLFNQRKSSDPFDKIQPVVPSQIVASESTTTQATSLNGIPMQQTTTVDKNIVGSTMEPEKRQDLSALSHLDSRASQVLMHAQQETQRIKQALIEPDQLLFGLLFDEEIFKLLEQFSVDAAKLSHEIQTKEMTGVFVGQPTLSDPSKAVFEQAYRAAKTRGVNFIAPEDLLLEMFSSNATVATTLQSQGVQKAQVEEKLAKSNRYKPAKKSVIEQYGVDLTEKARNGELDPVAGRDKEVERIVHILLRRTKNNPIIIGEAGVGKTAIVEGLAQLIVDGKSAKDLSDKRIIQIDVASLVAGASHRGEFEERLKGVINEAMASAGKIILFIDEIHTLIGTGDSDGALDASNIIKPHLARGQMQIIGTTTTAEYRKYFEKDKAFERRFQPVIAEEPDEEAAVAMMKVLKPKYEKFHNVVISDDTLVAAVKLSKKYIGERYLPDKAVDLIDEASAEVKLAQSEGGSEKNVKKTDIEKVVSSWTGIPITKLTEDESEKLLHLDDLIHKRFIDQIEAVTAVSEAVRRGRIGLAAANRPIASFIFLGPTGVGKTELAKTLAELLFGKEEAMIRLDMSEYMEKHEVAKLIGAPPGYVGYEEGGQLTEAVRTKPYSIVLLDEVEKAHPDVFNILLQVLEDGRLTDNKGNTISFKNTIIIATSNIGSGVIQEKLSKTTATNDAEFAKEFAELNTLVSEELHKFFRPELLNRFDEIVIFKPLRQEDMSAIARLGIEKTGKLLKEQGYTLQISDAGVAELAKEGYDPVYGARPLRRLIQTAIENPIALLIIGKTFVPGDGIMIDYDQAQSKFTFVKYVVPTQQAQVPASNAADAGEPGQPPVDPNAPQVPPSPGGTTQPVVPVDPTVPGQEQPQQMPGAPVPQEPQQVIAPPPTNGVITDPTDPVKSAYENMLKSYVNQGSGMIGQPPAAQPQQPASNAADAAPSSNGATMAVGSIN